MVKMQHMYDIYQKARRIFFKNPSDWEKKNSVGPTHLSFSQITCVTAVLYASFNTLHIKIRQHETLSSNIMR